ncbi:hypothetical protein HY631_04460 [Candidatus Uhrbacteria bacterium]|nr:hypothetical protein [Candidatus Uhrbacteria bacterium]
MGVHVIRTALGLLQHYVPEEHAAVRRKVLTIAFSPTACGPGALACITQRLHRVAILAVPPEQHGVLETAISISHEARHIWLWPDGSSTLLPHRCGRCDTAESQATDAIYQRDGEVRARIQLGLEVDAILASEDRRRRHADCGWLLG